MWGLCKKLGFFATGAGIAVDLAAKIAKPSVSTVANLTAVAGGSVYSISKNFETVRGISEQRRDCSEILNEMYGWAEVDNIQALLDNLAIERKKAQRIVEHIELVNRNSRWAYVYAGINTAVQLTLSAISIGINAAASQRNDDDICHDPIHIMNMFLIPTLIFSQYIIHSVFIASSLRRMDNQSTELKADLQELKSSIRAQVLKLNKLSNEIDNHHQRLTSLNVSIERDNEQIVALRTRLEAIGSEPISIGEDEMIGTEFIRLSGELDILEKKVINSMEDRKSLAKALQALLRDTDELIMELGKSFIKREQFDAIDRYVQAIKPQLDQEIEHNSSPLSL